MGRPWDRKFLGFRFRRGPEAKRGIARAAVKRFKTRVRKATRRARGVSLVAVIAELRRYFHGWRQYYGFTQTPTEVVDLEKWTRHRLRSLVWQQWRTRAKRYAELRRLGVSARSARMAASSGGGPWCLSRTPALHKGLSNAYFRSLGLPSLFPDGFA